MRKYKSIFLWTLFVGLFLLTQNLYRASERSKGHKLIGQNAPMATLPPVVFEGAQTETSDKKIILFVASWCHHCPQVFEQLKTLDLPIWVVLYHDKKPVSERLQAGAARVFRDETGSFSSQWGLRGVPEFFVLGAENQILAHHPGLLDDAGLKALKKTLLQNGSK